MSLPSLDEIVGAKPAPERHYTDGALVPIMEEVGDIVDLLDREAPAYCRAYLDHLRSGTGQPPRAPVGMHRKVAATLRDVVLDHAVHARYTAGVRAGQT